MSYPSSAQYIWNYLMNPGRINNAFGVAAMMGNLQAESGLYPNRLQGDFTAGYTKSADYTAKVDNGTISEYDFVHNGPGGGGYGLAQWTWWSRKQNLYNRRKQLGYKSVGDIGLACDYLWEELQTSYQSVLKALKEATDIRTPSDVVLHQFERPADQSVAVEEARAALGTAIYNTFKNSSVDPAPTPPDTPDTPDTPDVPSTPSTLYVGTKTSTPYICISGVWKSVTPYMFKNGVWISAAIQESEGGGDDSTVTPPTEVWIRSGRPEDNNPYYNKAGTKTGAISTCILGEPNVPELNVLKNCVGCAWGAFNETWAKNAPNAGPPDGFYRKNGNADTIIDNIYNDPASPLYPYVVRMQDIKDPDNYIPPLGGLIVWSKIHVAYISGTTYNDVSLDKDTIYVEQSAYGGVSNPGTNPETSPWAGSDYGTWAHSKLKRNKTGMAANCWWFNYSAYAGGTCLGFVKNPALKYDENGNCLGLK